MSAYAGEWVASSLLQDRAETLGDRVAISSSTGSLTYAELADEAARVAAGLRELGVGPGDRVATMLPTGLEYLKVWWGIVWAGAVDVPVNNEFKGEMLRHVLRGSGAEVVVIDPRWLDRLDAPPEHVVSDPGSLRLDPAPRTPRAEADLLYVMYTSGTTGPAKGVMHVNRSALWNSAAWLGILSLEERDVAYSMFPIFHVTARSAVVTATLWAGGRVHLADGFSASRFWDELRAAGATWFGYMGIVIHLVHAQPPRPDDADNGARIAFGAAAPPGIMDAFEARFGMRLVEVYGSTELGPASTPVGGRRKPGTMGPPCPHLIVEVHDADDNSLPPGVDGEIVARPAEPYAMAQGYLNEPRATLEAFRNLWFHTGDGGHLDEDGHVVFTDRVKDSLRRRGENISSFEVERGVQAHPDVLECAAYAVPAELTEDEVMIAVVPREGREIDREDLARFCIAELPRFMVPRYVRVMDALPKTPSQRIEKYRLRDAGVTPDTFDREAAGLTVPRS